MNKPMAYVSPIRISGDGAWNDVSKSKDLLCKRKHTQEKPASNLVQ